MDRKPQEKLYFPVMFRSFPCEKSSYIPQLMKAIWVFKIAYSEMAEQMLPITVERHA